MFFFKEILEKTLINKSDRKYLMHILSSDFFSEKDD